MTACALRTNTTIVGTRQAPTSMLGIWENDNEFSGTDRVDRQIMLNAASAFGGGPATTNNYTAIRYTSYSGAPIDAVANT